MDSIIKGMMALSNSIETHRSEIEHPKLEKPKDYTKNQSVIHDMITENTGVNMLDSGFYGRHWEKNRSISDFRDTETCFVQEDMISLNLFHWLDDKLSYDEEMDKKFQEYSMNEENKDKHWLECMDDFAEKYGVEDNYLGIGSGNSYNEESCLSQSIQYTYFSNDSGSYVILQTHNGADIRGGYSEPKVFSCELEQFLMAISHLSGSCQCGYADSDSGGYSFYDSDFAEIKDGFPSVWKFSKKHQAYFCTECHTEVGFY